MRHLPAARRLFAQMILDERGSETLEYATTLGFLAAGGFVVQSVGNRVLEFWRELDAALSRL